MSARAVIFAQMVDDASAHPDLFPTEKKQEKEPQRLFKMIEDLVQWANTTNEEVLERARRDPAEVRGPAAGESEVAGGDGADRAAVARGAGARRGRALLRPVGANVQIRHTRAGGTGVRSAVRSHLEEYPYRIEVTAEMAKGRPDLKPYVGRKLTVIAWLWARTAYRLYTLCERKKRAKEAMAYNGLVQSWPEIMQLSRGEQVPAGPSLFDES